MVDVLYVVRGEPDDQRLVRRLGCSVRSILANSCPPRRIGIFDTSPHSFRARIQAEIGQCFDYRHLPMELPYNKSRNLNLAVRDLSSAQHLMLTDLDMVFAPDHIARCLELVDEFPVITYRCHALNAEFYSERLDELLARPGVPKRIGGGVFVQRSAYLRLNGFDEAYRGWGAEDSDFLSRAEQVYRIQSPCDTIQVAHLWHPVNDPHKQLHREINRERYYTRLPMFRSGELDPGDIESILRQPQPDHATAGAAV